MKRPGDLMIAWALIMFTLPLMVIVALAIKLESSPGPVLVNRYITRGGRRIDVLKFRTTLHQPQNVRPIWSSADLTRVGWFMRYTRIEYLPQLIHVLRGDLTLTGATGRHRPDFGDWP
jgi:lipopolysaccharide/colanic/teichoic acid biosynthesis glycosyltransferase